MKKAKLFKSVAAVLAAAIVGAGMFAGCAVKTPPPDDGDEPNPPPVDTKTVVSRICTLESGKTYVEVDGKPFAIRGGQVRADGWYNRSSSFTNAIAPLTDAECEEYFAQGKALGLNTLELALEWKQLEPEKDVYDFTLVDKMLGWANKYDLKCEFLWFSTNMCGDTHSFTIPDYILEDTETYPRIQGSTYYSHMYGDVFHLVINDEDLMQRETLVLEKLMAHVYEWNKANGEKNPLIGMQVHNEADGMVRWRRDQMTLKLDGERLSYEEVWAMTLDALDNAGKAIKNSDYKIYTRCNMTTSYDVGEFPECPGTGISPLDILRLEGIDIIGSDPYRTTAEIIGDVVNKYNVEGNYPHIAENMGEYASSASMFLAAYQAGGSYMFYDLATPQYFIQINAGSSYQMDQGILNPDFSYKAHTQITKNIIGGIAAMGSVLPLVESRNFAAFNIATETPVQKLTQSYETDSATFTYETENGGIAFAIEHEGYIYLYSTEACKIGISGAELTLKADVGYLDGDEFIAEESAYLTPPTVTVAANKLYRIKLRNVA